MSDKFYVDIFGSYCLNIKTREVADKHHEFQKNFKLLTGHVWSATDCHSVPNLYIKKQKQVIGVEKCICTKPITTCLRIVHEPTNIMFQVGCVCWKQKTNGIHDELIAKLKKDYDDSLKSMCSSCCKLKKELVNHICKSCTNYNERQAEKTRAENVRAANKSGTCQIVDYPEDRWPGDWWRNKNIPGDK